jgi:hypothetical protein
MERGNFSAAAGFGFDPDKFGVFSTFSAFLEMVISELTMARLNNCNVLSHFSHSGGKFLSYIARLFIADSIFSVDEVRSSAVDEEWMFFSCNLI